MLQKPLSGSHRPAFLFAPRHTDILDRSLPAHRRGRFGGMDAAKEPTRTYLRRVPRWWAGGPATSPSSRRATNADEGRRHTLKSRTRHVRRQHQSRAHACTPTQILRNPNHRSIDSHLPAYRLTHAKLHFALKSCPHAQARSHPTTLGSLLPPSLFSIENKLTAAAHSTPMASLPAT
ncbi:hypothetical protein EIQ04_17935 [Xanthomonas campestris pv. raphani]